MRKSYQQLYSQLQRKTGDSNANVLIDFKESINETNRKVLNYSWPFLEQNVDMTIVANQNNYTIPNNYQRISDVYVTIGKSGTNPGTKYRPKFVDSVKFWNYLQSLRIAVSSNITQFVYREGDQILLWPAPQTSGGILTIFGRKNTQDLSIDDYTTGTIVSIANAGTAVVGGGTSWATGTIGNRIQIDYPSGDFQWYPISSITSTTGLVLEKQYLGPSIVAGSATYRIGEFSDIPDDFLSLLIYRPLAIYYGQMENPAMATYYWKLYDGGQEMSPSNMAFPGGLLGQMYDKMSQNFEGHYIDELQPTEPSTADLIIKNFNYTGEGW